MQPSVSDLARKLNLTGTVRIEITIAPDGTVNRTRVIGGHPVLAADAERAAQKCTFEPGPTETVDYRIQILDFLGPTLFRVSLKFAAKTHATSDRP